MKKPFTPPYPKPHKTKSSFVKRLFRAWDSWIHVVYEKSYTLKLGEVNMPHIDMYVAGEPNLVDEIMRNENNRYPKHQQLTELLKPLMGESIFTTNGDVWAAQRHMLKSSFGQTHLKRTFADMDRASDDLLNNIQQRYSQDKHFDVEPFMTHVTADIIYRTMFSKALSESESEKIYTSFHRYQKNAQRAFILRLYSLPSFVYSRAAKKDAQTIRKTFSQHIKPRFDAFHALDQKAQDNYENTDILDSLITARHPQTQQRFTMPEIINQLGLFFIAGHETSATALTWALYLIAKSPTLQDQLYNEACLAFSNEQLSFANLKQLKQTQFVFQEALRLYPPVAFLMREASCPMKIRDKHIKQGSLMIVSPWLIQRSSNHWKNPHEFDPQRFDTTDTQAQQRCPMHEKSLEQAYLPFGKGERICMGAAFAQQEALIILSKIIKRFELRYIEKKEPEAISRVTTRPKYGIKIYFKQRDN